jgi:uncharacterized protein
MNSKKIRYLFYLSIFLCLAFQKDSLFYTKLAEKALEQTKLTVSYVPDYVKIKYPNGDVPANTGVCTDLVIRAYREVGIDLQKEVHEDMLKQFAKYPNLWKLKKADSNIDHRRVPNLMTFFEHKNARLKISANASDYKPGDLVSWNLQNKNTFQGITHIGIVTAQLSNDGKTYLIAHNIGAGNTLENMLFSYTIIGHYRFSK